MGLEDPEERWVEPQDRRGQGPDRQQRRLAPEVVTDFDVFLVLVGGLVDVVVALGLKEEVTHLPAHHRHQPRYQRRCRWILEDGDIRGQKAHRAEQVQGLIDTAVMVVAVIVAALKFESAQKALRGFPLDISSDRLPSKYNGPVTTVLRKAFALHQTVAGGSSDRHATA